MMSRRNGAWALAFIDVVAFIVASLFQSDADYGATVFYVVGIASFTAIGALLWTRVPANPIGVMLLAAGTVLVAAVVVGTYANLGSLQAPPWPGSGLLAETIGNILFIYPFGIALIGVPLVFPDGRLPSPRFRWVVWVTIATMVAWTLGVIYRSLLDGGSASSIPGLADLEPFVGALDVFASVSSIVGFGGAAAAIWVRFRRGDPVQRQQVKWLMTVAGLVAIVFPASFLVPNPELANALDIVGILAFFALPVVIGIAILRYRLYEIDRVVSRTIAYAIVSAILAAVFGGVILFLSTALAAFTQGPTIAVAASTLVAFAVFQPVLHRVQRGVDRRFNRARYDAEQTAVAFSARMRDEVDLQALTADLDMTVHAAVAPARLGLWLRQTRR